MNSQQRRKSFRVADRKAEEHNRRARELTANDPGTIERDRMLREWVADRHARGLLGPASEEETAEIIERMKAVPLTPDPEHKTWIHSVIRRRPMKRVYCITVMPDSKTGYEGEMITRVEHLGKTTETRRPLKGLIA